MCCRAFNNSRTLAQQGAPLALLAILKDPKVDTASLAAVCSAAKKVAANEDICKELADAGAVGVTMQVHPASRTVRISKCMQISMEVLACHQNGMHSTSHAGTTR